MIMDHRTFVKLVLSTSMLTLVFLGSMIVPSLFTDSLYIIFIFMAVGFLLMCFFVAHFYSMWFKDYIEKFWSEKEQQ